MKSARARLGEIVLVLISVVLTVIACEALYRIYLGFRLDTPTVTADGKCIAVSMITDPVLGYRFRQGIADYRNLFIKDNHFDRARPRALCRRGGTHAVGTGTASPARNRALACAAAERVSSRVWSVDLAGAA
jgi:hypothetical protein